MCKLFSKYEKEIQNYCKENGLSFEKALKMPQCWSKNDIWLQYHDPEKGKNGLTDETISSTIRLVFSSITPCITIEPYIRINI